MASLIGSKAKQKAMELLVPSSGRPLEPIGNDWPRWMVIRVYTRQNPGYKRSHFPFNISPF